MSVNRNRPQKCATKGCGRFALPHNPLCQTCWNEAWAVFEDSRNGTTAHDAGEPVAAPPMEEWGAFDAMFTFSHQVEDFAGSDITVPNATLSDFSGTEGAS